MIFLIENGQLNTDLDCRNKNLSNVGSLSPLPTGLVGSSDPRLSDMRVPLDGSVTNAKVAAAAGITQDKLALTGTIPAAWLGTGATQAAAGNLAEYVSKKGAVNGYAGLDGTGKVPAIQMPVGAGLGTVTSVALSLPVDFAISGGPVTGAGTLTAIWASVAAASWFGNPGPGSAAPAFQSGAVPATLIPPLDAAKIGTGVIAVARLPVAIGTGPSSAPGLVPNPGASGPGVFPTDYLARDMTFKPAPAATILDAAFGPSWNGATAIAPSQNSVYAWGKIFDPDGNGKVNVLDQGAGIPITNSSGVLGTPLAAPAGALVGTSDTQNISNKRLIARILTLPGAVATPTFNTDTLDAVFIGVLTTNITSMTTGLSGSPGDFDRLVIRILDDGVVRSIAWGTAFFSTTNGILPTATVANKIMTVELRYNTLRAKWACTMVTTET